MFKKTLVFLFIVAATSFQGFSQTKNLDKEMDSAIEELSSMLDTLDLQKLFNFDIAKQLEEITPDAQQLEGMEQMMQQSLQMLQSMDLSVFEEMMQQFEGQFQDMEKLMPQMPKDPKAPKKMGGEKKPATKKI